MSAAGTAFASPGRGAPGRAIGRRPDRGLRALGLALLAAATLLAGCGTPTPRSGRDGPAARPPPNLDRVPDAVPRVETIRAGGPNKPYQIGGRWYSPQTADLPMRERGLASWYGRKFHGLPTANGERYDMHAMTAAHPTMPLPSYARVRNPANGREIVVRINDRGPFVRGRVIDLSYTAALKLDLLRAVAPVELVRITNASIRDGSWRDGAGDAEARAPTRPPAPVVAANDARRAPVVPVLPPPEAVDAGGAGAETASAGAADTASSGDDVSLAAPLPPRALRPASPGFWVQLGAFQQRDGALLFLDRVSAEADWLAPQLTVIADASLHRLQAGPYGSRGEADEAAERVRESLQLVPVIVERR